MSLVDELSRLTPLISSIFGSGGLLVLVGRAYIKWRDQSAQEQREIEQRKLREKLQGQLLYEMETRNRQRLQEYASKLRMLLFARGVKEEELPLYPPLEDTKDTLKGDL